MNKVKLLEIEKRNERIILKCKDNTTDVNSEYGRVEFSFDSSNGWILYEFRGFLTHRELDLISEKLKDLNDENDYSFEIDEIDTSLTIIELEDLLNTETKSIEDYDVLIKDKIDKLKLANI